MPDGTRELRLVVTAPDYDAALRFYRDVLGLREESSFADDNGGRATVLHAGRATIELADEAHAEAIDALEVGHRVAGPVRVAFEVTDAADVTARLVAAGARLVAPPVRTPWGSLNARLDGPDGQQLTVYTNDVYVTARTRLDGPVGLAEPDPAWAAAGAEVCAEVRRCLGRAALVVEHVGSTAVPGLPAKPLVDVVLGVADPADESAYIPALEAAGYRLHVREPEWHQHRLLKHAEPDVNLHVFAAGSDEITRMVAFRDHLRRDEADRERYLGVKRELAGRTWAFTQDYADAKADVVADILRRAELAGAAEQRASPWPRRVTIAVFVATVLQLLVATAVPDLAQFEGKGFAARLLAYPAMMLFVPAVWYVAQRRRPEGERDEPPWTAFSLVMAPFLIDVTGNTLDLYDTVDWWDDANHFVNWFLLNLGLGLLLLRTRAGPPWALGLLVAGLGALLAIAWEVGEWYAFIRHGTELATAYEDTLGDEVLGSLGAAVAGLLVARRAASLTQRR